jgi:hypothetical protein
MRARRQLSSRTRRRAKEPKDGASAPTVALDADTIAVLGHLRTALPGRPIAVAGLTQPGRQPHRPRSLHQDQDPLETRRRGVWLGLAGTRHLQPQALVALVLHLRDREQPARSPGSYVGLPPAADRRPHRDAAGGTTSGRLRPRRATPIRLPNDSAQPPRAKQRRHSRGVKRGCKRGGIGGPLDNVCPMSAQPRKANLWPTRLKPPKPNENPYGFEQERGMEAGGIEPPSESHSPNASTCVSDDLSSSPSLPSAGSPATSRRCNLGPHPVGTMGAQPELRRSFPPYGRGQDERGRLIRQPVRSFRWQLSRSVLFAR